MSNLDETLEAQEKVKILWFVRGCSGAGKSTVAKLLREQLPFGCGTEADDFRYIDGRYAWGEVPNYIAHRKCYSTTKEYMIDGRQNIVVSNTSTRSKDVTKYRILANMFGYMFISIVVENYHESGNVHGVPYETLVDMENKLRKSIKLI